MFTLRARLYYKRCMHQLNKEGFCRENLLSVGSFTLISKMGLNEREINKQYKKETSISKCFFLKQNNEVNLWAINLSSPKIQLSLVPAIFYLYQFCLYKKSSLKEKYFKVFSIYIQSTETDPLWNNFSYELILLPSHFQVKNTDMYLMLL